MKNSQIKSRIEAILKQDDRLWNEEKTELNQTLLLDLVDKIDENIIDLLLQDNDLREKFFVKVKDVYVFKTNDFKFFMEEHKVDNSFTQYKNQIGLTDGKRFIKDTNDVVLDFPYKDCVLEGGQSTEEGIDNYYEYSEKNSEYEEKQAKRKEIFFNQILAEDEIDRLFDEKAFVNWKRFTKDGEQKVSEIKRDDSGIIRENMIIKGNNLLALHSLKKQFAGKIKLIYIDPPYNTGGDAETFTYNNNFKHSSWLTFLKNRLETAKHFLRNDGFIAIAIDHVELFYLGTLADEIFGRDNRIGIVTVVHKPEGRNQEKFFGTSTEYMLVYSRDKNIANFKKVILDEKQKDRFDKKDDQGRYRLKNFIRLTDGKYSLKKNKPSHYYPIFISKDLNKFSLENIEGYEKVLPITDNGVERTWKTKGDTFIKLVNRGEIEAKRNNNKIVLYEKLREDQVIKTHWVGKRYHAYHFGTKLLENILGRKAFSFPKSLYTILDTLKIMTSDNDIVLDFYTGSGTAGHALLALNKEDMGKRNFILIEQIDEHIAICKERIQKVMKKENIDVSFIYFELAKWNEKAKEEVLACDNLEELVKLFDALYEKYFLNYNLKIKEFKEKVINEAKFKELSLDEQKKMFLTMLDLNQIYVQKSEMADKRFGISEEDQELTNKFYNSDRV
jgi:adenine-specific DNA-methyltransferase